MNIKHILLLCTLTVFFTGSVLAITEKEARAELENAEQDMEIKRATFRTLRQKYSDLQSSIESAYEEGKHSEIIQRMQNEQEMVYAQLRNAQDSLIETTERFRKARSLLREIQGYSSSW